MKPSSNHASIPSLPPHYTPSRIRITTLPAHHHPSFTPSPASWAMRLLLNSLSVLVLITAKKPDGREERTQVHLPLGQAQPSLEQDPQPPMLIEL
jgi:hypothetical protein